jgi:hypothetical protein
MRVERKPHQETDGECQQPAAQPRYSHWCASSFRATCTSAPKTAVRSCSPFVNPNPILAKRSSFIYVTGFRPANESTEAAVIRGWLKMSGVMVFAKEKGLATSMLDKKCRVFLCCLRQTGGLCRPQYLGFK